MKSLIEQIRSEGYKEGFSQASKVSYEEAFDKGKKAARSDSPFLLMIWQIGALCGILLSIAIFLWSPPVIDYIMENFFYEQNI